jgi:hypothetical protein
MALLEDVVNFRLPMDQPAGKALAYSAGFGLSRGLSGVLFRTLGIPPQFSPIALAVIAKLDAVSDIVGDDISELVATTAWIDAITNVIPIGSTIMGLFQPLGAPAAGGGILSTVGNLLKAPFKAFGLISDIDTLIPIEEEDLGQVEEEMLTSLEGKFAAIAG